ncbi:AAA family ATPase [Undibacterium danionis]|uniref:AAA family ATPase n=1 Tax=Undibacterium danionis TaxID=1812100 RepID=A0ABV6IJH1_9BURK
MELLLYCGLPGAGKSTYYKLHHVDTHIRLNLDMLKTRERERLLLEAALQAKAKLVIDNTNPDVLSRSLYIQAALQARYQVICYWFCAPFEEALARNDLRTGTARVSRVGIASIAKQFITPSYEEGFHEIHRVHTLDHHRYNLERSIDLSISEVKHEV